jgi:hypothetical protein
MVTIHVAKDVCLGMKAQNMRLTREQAKSLRDCLDVIAQHPHTRELRMGPGQGIIVKHHTY